MKNIFILFIAATISICSCNTNTTKVRTKNTNICFEIDTLYINGHEIITVREGIGDHQTMGCFESSTCPSCKGIGVKDNRVTETDATEY